MFLSFFGITCWKIVSSNFRKHLLSTYQMHSSVLGALWGPRWMRQDECLLGAYCKVREGQHCWQNSCKTFSALPCCRPGARVYGEMAGNTSKIHVLKEVDWSDDICAVSRELWWHQDWGKRWGSSSLGQRWGWEGWVDTPRHVLAELTGFGSFLGENEGWRMWSLTEVWWWRKWKKFGKVDSKVTMFSRIRRVIWDTVSVKYKHSVQHRVSAARTLTLLVIWSVYGHPSL